MIVLFVIIAALLVSLALIGAVALVVRRTTISIVIRKDPDMATIKERLAALEAQAADHAETLATKDALASVAARVDAIDAEIGEDDADVMVAVEHKSAPLTAAAAAAPFA